MASKAHRDAEVRPLVGHNRRPKGGMGQRAAPAIGVIGRHKSGFEFAAAFSPDLLHRVGPSIRKTTVENRKDQGPRKPSQHGQAVGVLNDLKRQGVQKHACSRA